MSRANEFGGARKSRLEEALERAMIQYQATGDRRAWEQARDEALARYKATNPRWKNLNIKIERI